MRLPPKVMAFLRSRGLRRSLMCSPLILAILGLLFYGVASCYGTWKCDRTIDALVARGFARTMAEAIGPMPPDHENLLKHPVVLAEMARKNRPAEPQDDPDYDPFHPDNMDLDPFEPEVADRIPPPREPDFEEPLDFLIRMWSIGNSVSKIVERRDPETPLSYGQLHASDFSRDGGREEAQALLQSMQGFDGRRRALIDVLMRCRPGCADGDELDEQLNEAFQCLLLIKFFLDQHGVVCLAAGRKKEAMEDLLAALTFATAVQTTALPGGADCAYEIRPTVRAALLDPPCGTWTDDELRVFDDALRDACSGDLTMRFQRMHITLLIEHQTAIRDGRVPRPRRRFSWAIWRMDWRWDWPSAKHSLAEAWEELKPPGLRDLELAGELEAMAERIESLENPKDWEKLLRPTGSYREYELRHIHEDTEAIAWKFFADDYRYPYLEYNDDRASSLGWEIEGAVWTALARHAIALERHRLRHGTHPVSIDQLDPDLAEDLPIDPFSRQPFIYRREANGGFMLKALKSPWVKEHGYTPWRYDEEPYTWRKALPR